MKIFLTFLFCLSYRLTVFQLYTVALPVKNVADEISCINHDFEEKLAEISDSQMSKNVWLNVNFFRVSC